MKRIAGSILIITVMVLISAQLLYAEAKVVVKEIVTITVDKAQVRTDVPPINVNGRTLVPIRGVFNAFGADIDWFPVEKRAYIRDESKVIWLQIGDAHAKVDDAIVPLDAPATIYRGRTMVPLRFVAETLGATVNWNAENQTITILTRSKAQPTPAPADTETEEPAPSDDMDQ
ncbi:MAG: copper amine oxidase N-terminal domain-containing protein [Armatimonadota bacterium]